MTPWWHEFIAGRVRPMRCKGYLGYLAEQPCAVTGARPVTVHHLVGHGLEGQGTKTSDFLAMPLSPEMHLPLYPNAIHAMGQRAWERQYEDQRILVLQCLLQAIHEGRLVFRA